LACLLDAVPEGLRVAVELRDPSWLCRPVYRILRDHCAALCIHDLVEHHPRVVTADWVYLRFHGPNPENRYTGAYSARTLAGAARRIRRHLDEGRDVYAYFNNDVAGHAVRDALRLKRYLEDG
jgi:uncharacterized protein YecE (DUF72 family)